METLATKLKKSQKDLMEHGAELLGQTKDASRGFATFVQGEARDWTTYIKERAGEIRLEDVKANAAGLLGKVTGRGTVEVEPQDQEPGAEAEGDAPEA